LDARPGIEVERVSSIYETEPLGPPQPRYLNAAFRLRSELSPTALLHVLLRTERRLGRQRSTAERWGPRSIDLDLLWDERGVHTSTGLCVPHAELESRNFALAPLLDVMPEVRPELGPSLDRLGEPLETWSRAAIVEADRSSKGFRARVESDSLADACALGVAELASEDRRPWSTRHVTIPAEPAAFATVLQRLLRTGFAVDRATVSHCSDAQWVLEFHGVNEGLRVDADVRLQPTSGTRRGVDATLSVTRSSR
jgi:2-amino-4-hydroxy-6-hydroxymethyldihydropteridine diphosphokinase